MIRTIAIAVIGLVGVVLAYAATRPDTFTVERRAWVKAPPERIQPLISDMRAFNQWNPFNRKDPAMHGVYRGPAAGPGAHYAFKGNSEVGSGSIEIVQAGPRKVTMKLDMTEPLEAHNKVEFLLVPRGDATEVTWAMNGATPFVGKVLHLFIDMDRMVGGEFEKGLAELKRLAERS